MIRILSRSASKKGTLNIYLISVAPVETIQPLPFFKIQDAPPKLPSIDRLSASDLLVKNHPDFKKERVQMITAIDPKSPDALSLGDIISVETIRSKSYPRSGITTGILKRIRHFGYSSSLFVESVVMGTTIQTQFKIYSPLVKNISLVKKRQELVKANANP